MHIGHNTVYGSWEQSSLLNRIISHFMLDHSVSICGLGGKNNWLQVPSTNARHGWVCLWNWFVAYVMELNLCHYTQYKTWCNTTGNEGSILLSEKPGFVKTSSLDKYHRKISSKEYVVTVLAKLCARWLKKWFIFQLSHHDTYLYMFTLQLSNFPKTMKSCNAWVKNAYQVDELVEGVKTTSM